MPKLKDLDQKIPTFPNCDNYGVHRSSNPNPTSDDVKLNDTALHQQRCTHFKVDYLEEMDVIKQAKDYSDIKGAGDSYRFKRATALWLWRKESSTSNFNTTSRCSDRWNFD